MQYELRIQDPTDSTHGPLLNEVVALVGDGQVSWLRMFFGFLTGSGVDALMGVPAVRDVLLQSEVEVLVGLDTVTDRPGLEGLLKLATENPQFTPKVIKNTTRALIHPKMLVAKYADGRAVAVVGSNNLTLGGLSRNVEGYTIARFDSDEDIDLSDWDEFVQRWDSLITEIDDEALEAAEQNARRLKRLKTAARETRSKPNAGIVVSDGQVFEMPVSEIEHLEEPVLVAQVPKAAGRWSQVGYSAKAIRDYFDVKAGDQVFLREFDSAAVEEHRVIHSEVNQNYRIELGAAIQAGDYPADGRPVALFRRESGAVWLHRYVFLMPEDDGHAEMTALAVQTFNPQGNQVARVIVPRSRVLAAWPGCPL